MSSLPLPIARLRRRSHNAKSAKDRHDTAYFALEASVRLAVAAEVPQDPGPLRRGGVGAWCAALARDDVVLERPALAELYSHLASVGGGGKEGRTKLRSRHLLDALASYRNKVIGHGSVRDPTFYERAAPLLLRGLDALWDAGLFFPPAAHLLFVESVTIGADGTHLARVLDLMSESPLVLDLAGTRVPEGVLPHRLYLHNDEQWQTLHPLFLLLEASESSYAFNGLGRRVEFLDYASGATLTGNALDQAFPGLADQVRAFFESPTEDDEAQEEEGGEELEFGNYRIIGKLGEGAMGEVYLAEQQSLGRKVAVKMLPSRLLSDRVAVARFRREIRALARAEHPHVVKILDSGESNGAPYYVMEYVEGANLGQVAKPLATSNDFHGAVSSAWGKVRDERSELFDGAVAAETNAPTELADSDRFLALAACFRDAARGLHHLHERGIVHRDISPANLMVTATGARAVVMDLGLAAMEDASKSLSLDRSRLLGTLRYLPPELLTRNLVTIDRRADVYSLGAVLYELIADRPLFDGDTEPRLIEQILRKLPPPLRRVRSDCPRDLEVIVRRAVEKDPGLRYGSAEELARDLDNFLEGRPINARPPTAWYFLKLAILRNRALAVTAVVAVVVTLALVVIAFYQLQATLQVQRASVDYHIASDLLLDADEIRSLTPRMVPELERWIGQARALQERLPGYERLRDGTPADAVPAVLRQRERLVSQITAVGQLLPEVTRDLDRTASLWHRSIEEHDESWEQAIDDVRASPKYGGLEITPQAGLVPLGMNPQGYHEFWVIESGELPQDRDPETGHWGLTRETGVVLILVPGGTFNMGSRVDPPQGQDLPLHAETLEPFLISKYEVTQGQWYRELGVNPSAYRADTLEKGRRMSWLQPVENLSWNAAKSFSFRFGLNLPTEAQWEYASRAGTETVFHWGDSEECLEDRENIRDLSMAGGAGSQEATVDWDDEFPTPAPVGSFQPNAFGLFDTHGNVVEWCLDNYVEEFQAESDYRVAKGGNFNELPHLCRLSHRLRLVETLTSYGLSFRPVRPLMKNDW